MAGIEQEGIGPGSQDWLGLAGIEQGGIAQDLGIGPGSARIEQEGIGPRSQDWLGLAQDRLIEQEGIGPGSQDWLGSNQGLSQDLVLTLQIRITMCHESYKGAHICVIIIHQFVSSRITI